MEQPAVHPPFATLAARRAALAARYQAVRLATGRLAAPLAVEDTVPQPMPDVSPPKWHLGHTTWFYEHFCLDELQTGYTRHHPQYAFLFNSYYDAVGSRTPRPDRGFMTRPTLAEALAYRQAIDAHVVRWIETCPEAIFPELEARTLLGTHHEQQHLELLLTDLKYILSVNPLDPIYQPKDLPQQPDPGALSWTAFDAGVYEIGVDDAETHFTYDNEGPRHRVFLEAFEVADRLVTNREYLQFMADGGYAQPLHWLSEGWALVQKEGLRAPLYWFEREGRWYTYTLHGITALDPHAPVTHISYYEADAYAAWAGARLVTEAEWEVAATALSKPHAEGLFADSGIHHPLETRGWLGTAWQWTCSAYLPYPGYRRAPTALGEYNGKWMVNQHVLRGGSVATYRDHFRPTYRNFFHPDKRWQFTGIRLAR